MGPKAKPKAFKIKNAWIFVDTSPGIDKKMTLMRYAGANFVKIIPITSVI